MDKITLNDIKLTTIIGVQDWERRCPQNLHLDISLQTDAQKAASSDKLEDAIDYDNIVKHLLCCVENNHFQLIETLAEHLAQEILNHFPTEWVQIILHKPGALMQAKNVSITLERTKK